MTFPALVGSALDLIFPRRCLSCTAFLKHPLAGPPEVGFGAWLCAACRAGLEPCDPVRLSFPSGDLDGIASGYFYAGILEKIIPAWKYHRRYDLSPLILALCRDALARPGFPQGDAELVVAVPLSRRSLRKRGFNQSLLIAEQVAAVQGGQVSSALLDKVVETPRQATLDRKSRLQNLDHGVFRVVNPAAVRGRRVLLCDDVMTTGTTLKVAAAVLRRSGAVAVRGFTLARVA